MAAGWDRPMEDEFALMNLGVPSPYLSIMFPNCGSAYPKYLTLRDLSPEDREAWKSELLQFCKRLALDDDRRIVIKSPTHTARVRTLLEMFPDAKFVHLSRSPLALYRSTVALWKSLAAEEGLQVVRDNQWFSSFVIDSLRDMYDAYFEDRKLLRDDQLIELRYEDLVADPKGALRTIYERLDLGDFARVEPALDEHLTEVRNYRPNRHTMDDATAELIHAQWAQYFEEFGYE